MNFVPTWHTMLCNQQGRNRIEIIDLISLWRMYNYSNRTPPLQTRGLYAICSKNEKNWSNILTKLLLHTLLIFVFLADEHL